MSQTDLADPLVANEEESGLLVGGGVVGVRPPLPVPGDRSLPDVVTGTRHYDQGVQLNVTWNLKYQLFWHRFISGGRFCETLPINCLQPDIAITPVYRRNIGPRANLSYKHTYPTNGTKSVL